MKLTKEQQKLVLDNHNLIYKCLKKYNLSNEEYYDVAAYALCKAALHFNPDKGYKFSTYACMAILNEFKLQFRKNSLPEGYSLVSLNSTIEDPSDGRTKELEDIVGDEFNY